MNTPTSSNSTPQVPSPRSSYSSSTSSSSASSSPTPSPASDLSKSPKNSSHLVPTHSSIRENLTHKLEALHTGLVTSYHRGLQKITATRGHALRWAGLITPHNPEELESFIEVEDHLADTHKSWDVLTHPERQELIWHERRKRVHERSALSLYTSLISSDHTELISKVVAALSTEQYQRIMDLDVWHHDEIQIERVMHWLGVSGHLGTADILRRYRSLEEEYQIAILQPHVRGVSHEEYEELPPHLQQRLFSFPARAYHYEIRSNEPTLVEALHTLIEVFQQEDMEFALSLITHLTWCPPAESQHLAYQFSSARNEEDGFIPSDQALYRLDAMGDEECRTWLTRLNLETTDQVDHHQSTDLHSSVLNSAFNPASNSLINSSANSPPFLVEVMREARNDESWMSHRGSQLMQEEWIFGANNMASALGLKPRDHGDREEVFYHVLSTISLAVELISGGHHHRAQQILTRASTIELMRYGHRVIALMRQRVLAHLVHHGVVPERSEELLRGFKFAPLGTLLESRLLAVYDLIDSEHIKGLFNRFALAWLPVDSLPEHQSSESQDSYKSSPRGRGGIEKTSPRTPEGKYEYAVVDRASIWWRVCVELDSLIWLSGVAGKYRELQQKMIHEAAEQHEDGVGVTGKADKVNLAQQATELRGDAIKDWEEYWPRAFIEYVNRERVTSSTDGYEFMTAHPSLNHEDLRAFVRWLSHGSAPEHSDSRDDGSTPDDDPASYLSGPAEIAPSKVSWHRTADKMISRFLEVYPAPLEIGPNYVGDFGKMSAQLIGFSHHQSFTEAIETRIRERIREQLSSSIIEPLRSCDEPLEYLKNYFHIV